MKKTTIYIEGVPFTYDDEVDDISYDSISAISEEDAKKILRKVDTLFKQCNIKYSLAFGTLLGAVREGGLIKGDEDVDVFVESERNFRKYIPYLNEHGLKLCRIVGHYVYSFRINNNSYVDVYFKEKLPFSIWSLWCDMLYMRAVPRRYISRFSTINFLGESYPCPHKPERLLEFWYGKNWKTPVRGHKFTYETPSRYWWQTKGKYQFEKIKYYIKLPIKFLIGWKYWKKYIK